MRWRGFRRGTSRPANPVQGEDPVKAMSAGQVAITITDHTTPITHVPPRSGSLLSVSRATRLSRAQTPRGHVVRQLAPTMRGRALVIDIDFGSPGTRRRLTPAVDRLLQTLNVGSLSRGA